ncbi:MAG: hypothetical protein JSU07_01835 [Bacteroidetes bacterium]|nr:hypothetical protein [Bacteroidota bacterium]
MIKFKLKSSPKATFLLAIILKAFSVNAQSIGSDLGSLHGNYELDAQYYRPDSLIGAPKVPEKVLSNAFCNLIYQKGKLSAGMRYEAYNNVMQGFDPRYKGQGIVNRYVRYQDKLLDVTVGNIYEQFGSGLLFRTYYQPGLLYDNSLDGFRVISSPYKGLTFKGLIGRQRSFFSLGPGIVRAFDGEANLNDLLDSLINPIKTKIVVGGSFVSKYQSNLDPTVLKPLNVGAYGGRVNITHEGFNFYGEYGYKENDPGADNFATANGKNYYSYKPGEAIFLSSSYAVNGFAVLLQAKRIDNFAFRSDRDATLQNLLINYLPVTTKQHTYLMPAYTPYATQPRGEVGGMVEFQYKIKKGSALGGKYGTNITVNLSMVNGLNKIGVNDSTTTSYLYTAPYNQIGTPYYHDFFIEIEKKFNKKWKGTFMYANQFYNKNIIQFGTPNAGFRNMTSNIGVVDITYKYKSNSAVRFEVQAALKDNTDTLNLGSWTTAMVEWTPNTHWFVALLDQYNYGNPLNKLDLVKVNNNIGLSNVFGESLYHYFLLSVGYTTGPHRISISYGKQRAGIFCVGGVCRNVPASNGLSISITSTF